MTEFHKSSFFNLQSSIRALFSFLIITAFITSTESSAAQTWHTVRWVNDGDTVVLTTGQRVRYIGLNAPEIDHKDQKAQPYGYQAKSINKELVLSGKIRLEYDTERFDRYGRLLAYVFLDDGTFLNTRLLQAGSAFYLHHKPNLKYSQSLLKAQQEAMDLKKGLWRNWKETEKAYIGNLQSRRFHISTCPLANKIKLKNKIMFSSKWKAFTNGYAPSKKCIKEFWSY
jgi:endonuclease YncB( thermonuclease family)